MERFQNNNGERRLCLIQTYKYNRKKSPNHENRYDIVRCCLKFYKKKSYFAGLTVNHGMQTLSRSLFQSSWLIKL